MDNELNESLQDDTTIKSARKSLLIFWLRMLGWIGSGVVAPITTFAIKFGLFTETSYNVTTDELGNVTATSVAINGWGILSVLIIVLTVKQILDYWIEAQGTGYAYSKQVLTGFKRKIIPLAILIGLTYWLNGVMQQLQFCLIVLAISQTASIAVDPFPAWVAKKKGVEDYNDVLTTSIKSLLNKVNKGKGDK